MLAAIRTRPRALLPKTAASAAGWCQRRGATNGAEQDVWPPYRHLVERTPEPKEGERKVNAWDQANVRKQEMFSYHTPPFYKTRVEDLADKWGDLGFAIRPMNGHVRYTWSDGKWDDGQFVPAPYQLMHINSGALHYGVGVFEGMKAFASKEGRIRLMNPELNAQRMQRGADALLMPRVPQEMFVAGIKEAVRRNREFVPPHGYDASMYIRPLLFASGPMLGLAPLAQEYTFLVTVMPTGGYFGTAPGEEVGVKALVSEEHDRAAPKGTGSVKAAGNYAADLFPVHDAQRQGYNTTMYLDAKFKRYVEEFSVANFIGITHDGRYVTPTSDTILASTTNIMLQQIAQQRGLVVEQRPVDFQKEVGNFKEIGMCGTAAVVVKVASITRGSKTYEFPTFDTMAGLRGELTAIQHGDAEDTLGFMSYVCDVPGMNTQDISQPEVSYTPGMITAEAKGHVRRMGSAAVYGHERSLLEYVIEHAEAGNVSSVLTAMDSFWSKTFNAEGADNWETRSANIEANVQRQVKNKAHLNDFKGGAVSCLELGTYCGYSALLIARNLQPGSMLVSVERDPLFAAIATKIIEFAGQESKVRVLMGTAQSELEGITARVGSTCDLVLCDHSKEHFLPDLQMLEEFGLVDEKTTVIAELEVYPGDAEPVPEVLQEELLEYFEERKFHELATAMASLP